MRQENLPAYERFDAVHVASRVEPKHFLTDIRPALRAAAPEARPETALYKDRRHDRTHRWHRQSKNGEGVAVERLRCGRSSLTPAAKERFRSVVVVFFEAQCPNSMEETVRCGFLYSPS